MQVNGTTMHVAAEGSPYGLRRNSLRLLRRNPYGSYRHRHSMSSGTL